MENSSVELKSLISWFQSHGGSVDVSSLGFTTLPSCGRSAVALRDIPKGHTLFVIPRSSILSARTSSLPGRIGQELWNRHELGRAWVGLILCMMWEEAQGASSKWSGYLASLPTVFDTPMFWRDDELEELKGTTVVDKITKADAERDYHERLAPCLLDRPDLFPPDLIGQHFSLGKYHIMGSRILSRSFHVEKWEGQDEEKEDDGENAMDVDNGTLTAGFEDEKAKNESGTDEGSDSDGIDEDVEDIGDVAMVPMADMLNARYGSENAKLFYERNALRMETTKAIEKGEQIWNTYGNPPNFDLLRRYGHVDVIPLSEGGEGNPADIVEVRADLVVEVMLPKGVNDPAEKIDWWLEQGGDEFDLETNYELPEDFISFIRLLQLSTDEWEKTKEKHKLPKPKMDATIASIAVDVLTKRLSQYPTSIKEDKALLSSDLSANKRHAVFVRLGEKRILDGAIAKLQIIVERKRTPSGQGKRKAEQEKAGKGSAKKVKHK